MTEMPLNEKTPQFRRNTLAAVAGVLAGAGPFAWAIYGGGWADYGWLAFIGAPLAAGFASGLAFNAGRRVSGHDNVRSILITYAVGNGVLFFAALEGAICLVMAAPLSLTLTLVGAVFGSVLGRLFAPGRVAALFIAALLPATLLTKQTDRQYPVRPVSTTVEIDAPPEQVWQSVIGFADLPESKNWVFDLGLAHPIGAKLVGEGVGAVRHCEFSTGAFVEPITAWEPPHRLAFDVAEQPPPMEELSPYNHVHAPHLEGGFVSRRGQFLLTKLPDGRTRLTGTTWYELRMSPLPYWRLWAEWIVHDIHSEVLQHVKARAEAEWTTTASR